MHKIAKKIISDAGKKIFFFRKKEIEKERIKKILLISLYFRGDVLFNTGVIRILRKIFPYSQIDVLVKSRSMEVLKDNPNIDNLIVFDSIKTADYNDHSGFALKDKLSLLKKLRKEKYDLSIDLTGKYSTGLFSLLGKSRYSIGLNYNGFGFCYTKFIETDTQSTRGRLSEKYLNVVREGLEMKECLWKDITEGSETEYEIFLSSSEIETAEDALNKADITGEKPLICIQTTAGWEAKELSENRYAVLIGKLLTRGYDFVLIGSEQDREKNYRILDKAGSDLRKNYLCLPLKINAAVIRSSDIFIGSDSIGLHIASALNIPTIGLFGPTNPLFSAPVGSKHKIIYKKFDCSAPDDNQYCTRNAGKTCMTIDCMNQISPDEIISNVEYLLNKFYHSKRILA